MSIYTVKNLECLFYRLKSQGKLKMTDVPGMKEILGEINDRNDRISIVKRWLKRCNSRIADCQYGSEEYGNRYKRLCDTREWLEELTTERDDIKRKRDEHIADYLEKVFERIVRSRIRISPDVNEIEPGKYLVLVRGLEEKLICQLIKEDLKHAYKVVPADRNEIVEQLKGLLNNSRPKVIIRADIKKFFESVPLEDVIVRLTRNAYLNKISLTYLKRLHGYLREKTEFGVSPDVEERVCGLPRGLAFSSYLAEIYMQEIDDCIEAIEGVYYYRRYVDDIIIIASPDRDINDYWDEIKRCISTEDKRLVLHEDEKKFLKVSSSENVVSFDYLGYSFKIESNALSIGLSRNRRDKYMDMIDVIFKYYNKHPSVNKDIREKRRSSNRKEHSADPLHQLFAMLSCMTGNGHLEGDKRNVSIGSYFSNRHITDLTDLNELDAYLEDKINENFNPPQKMFCYGGEHDRDWYIERIRNVMRKWSFTEGFRTRRFCKNPKFTYTLGRIKGLRSKDF